MKLRLVFFLLLSTLLLPACEALPPASVPAPPAVQPSMETAFHWSTGEPVLLAPQVSGQRYLSVKEPSIVQSEDRWHLFSTVTRPDGIQQIAYQQFLSWGELRQTPPRVLQLGQHVSTSAPQILYFTPLQQWLLICTEALTGDSGDSRPAFSTNLRLDDPTGWTSPEPLLGADISVSEWRDFWLICDPDFAYLFFTTPEGTVWRTKTSLAEFPLGWVTPQSALTGDFFRSSHTYKIRGRSCYFTIVEAHRQWRRYIKAYTAPDLGGTWEPLAVTRINAFASRANVQFLVPEWTDSFSHGELLRSGNDERMEIDLLNAGFLFQGVAYRDRDGKLTSQIPWKLGLLRPSSLARAPKR